ncbi:MAG: hypothetical protein JSS83_16120 [Cyanobacteria bacterium SZAS LIN-3]|nr:hypothetical protein [Cyanobacteria bacterium SZAS LIN-3]
MDRNKNSAFLNLKDQIQTLKHWGETNEGLTFNPLDGGLKTFDGWANVSEAFLQFLSSKDVSLWSKKESSLVEELILLDWGTHKLLRELPDTEIASVIQRPYPNRNIRMYMLVKAGWKNSKSLRQSMAHYFYKNDDEQGIRLRAFEVLAECKWDQTDEEAQRLWQLGDTLSRMSVLKALQAANSSLLHQFIQEALMSPDPIVVTIANSVLYGPQ